LYNFKGCSHSSYRDCEGKGKLSSYETQLKKIFSPVTAPKHNPTFCFLESEQKILRVDYD